jgi:hypothetical protein
MAERAHASHTGVPVGSGGRVGRGRGRGRGKGKGAERSGKAPRNTRHRQQDD